MKDKKWCKIVGLCYGLVGILAFFLAVILSLPIGVVALISMVVSVFLLQKSLNIEVREEIQKIYKDLLEILKEKGTLESIKLEYLYTTDFKNKGYEREYLDAAMGWIKDDELVRVDLTYRGTN